MHVLGKFGQWSSRAVRLTGVRYNGGWGYSRTVDQSVQIPAIISHRAIEMTSQHVSRGIGRSVVEAWSIKRGANKRRIATGDCTMSLGRVLEGAQLIGQGAEAVRVTLST